MDYRKLAEEAVKAIFDEAENHQRTIGRDWAIDAAEKAMRQAPLTRPTYLDPPQPAAPKRWQ